MADEFKTRCDQARRDGARRILPAGTPHEDIVEAFRRHDLLEPTAEKVKPATAETMRVSADDVNRWFVGTFAPRMSDAVERRCADRGWIFRSLKLREWKAVKHPKPGQPKKVPVDRSLFGSYAFLRVADPDHIDWAALDDIDGLGGLVRRPLTHVPVVVPVGEVEKFIRLEEEGLFDSTRSRPPKVKRMDGVRISNGPFQGMRGFVSMTTGERVKVLLGMLGQIELPIDWVELCA